jgi:hypothetical protein
MKVIICGTTDIGIPKRKAIQGFVLAWQAAEKSLSCARNSARRLKPPLILLRLRRGFENVSRPSRTCSVGPLLPAPKALGYLHTPLRGCCWKTLLHQRTKNLVLTHTVEASRSQSKH